MLYLLGKKNTPLADFRTWHYLLWSTQHNIGPRDSLNVNSTLGRVLLLSSCGWVGFGLGDLWQCFPADGLRRLISTSRGSESSQESCNPMTNSGMTLSSGFCIGILGMGTFPMLLNLGRSKNILDEPDNLQEKCLPEESVRLLVNRKKWQKFLFITAFEM